MQNLQEKPTSVHSSEQPWWKLSSAEVCQLFSTDPEQGLTAENVQKHLTQYGRNQLPHAKPISPFALFFNQFRSVMVVVLVVAAGVSFFLQEWMDAIAILVIVVLNAVLGFVQEFRAEKSLAALKKLSSPTSKVMRSGQVELIASEEIVPGDIVFLEAGDKVPADGKLLKATQFYTQEAALTGESLPVSKNTKKIDQEKPAIADRKNCVFMGTVVVSGKAEGVVTTTGSRTEIGKIAKLIQEGTEEPTPLQERLRLLGYRLVLLFLFVVVAVFLLGIFRGNPWAQMLLTALSLAVAAIPEGMPAVVTISLALGVNRMAKRNALIRRLPSVETLGCATVICSDKTGTLTKNEMTVTHIWMSGKVTQVDGVGYAPNGSFSVSGERVPPDKNQELQKILRASTLCCSASLRENKNKAWEVIGDPTEGALLTVAAKAGLWKEILEEENPLIEEIPFDSERKRMSMLRKTSKGDILYTKGAPDVVIQKSSFFLQEGQEIPLNPQIQESIQAANKQLASQALRVLGVAYRKVNERAEDLTVLEEKLVFIGLMAMMDPPREEAKAAISKCRKAGIRVVMITGDHKETALAVAKEIGLEQDGAVAMSGRELDALKDDELAQKIDQVSVYARVSAENKLRIVRALKTKGEVVAMTGDGVNDAPAVKEASIGVAMGITGTDVTKEASDMVITDDNFASIVNAVEEGRGIYDNIVKFVNYLLSSNIAEVLVLFFGMLFVLKDPQGHMVVPLTALQILWMNLITDGLPAIALGADPLAPDAMRKPPRNPTQPILSFSFSVRIVSISLLITVGALTACLFGLRESAEMAQTMTLTTLISLQFVRVAMIRQLYKIPFFSNPWLIMSLGLSFVLQMGILYLPKAENIFGTVPLNMEAWGVIIAIAGGLWVVGNLINQILNRILKSE